MLVFCMCVCLFSVLRLLCLMVVFCRCVSLFSVLRLLSLMVVFCRCVSLFSVLRLLSLMVVFCRCVCLFSVFRLLRLLFSVGVYVYLAFLGCSVRWLLRMDFFSQENLQKLMELQRDLIGLEHLVSVDRVSRLHI